MKILLTGGTGFIGKALVQALARQGHSCVILTRSTSIKNNKNILYINSLKIIPNGKYYDCFINLAGANMAQGRWSEARKAELLRSRLDITRELHALASRLAQPPAVLLSASAIGYYGHQGDNPLSEEAAVVEGYAQRLCLLWEDEAERFAALGTRVCRMRLGVVLGRDGGPLQELTRSLLCGVSVWLGSGKQWLSWVHRCDVVRAMLFLLQQSQLSGAFNLTAPTPVTHRQFSDSLRKSGYSFLSLPVPAFIMRWVIGEMAEELLLNGQRVIPTRLQAEGFEFSYPSLREALPNLID